MIRLRANSAAWMTIDLNLLKNKEKCWRQAARQELL